MNNDRENTMAIEKTFAFTKQLEISLKNLLHLTFFAEERKKDIEHKLKLVSGFNQNASAREKRLLNIN